MEVALLLPIVIVGYAPYNLIHILETIRVIWTTLLLRMILITLMILITSPIKSSAIRLIAITFSGSTLCNSRSTLNLWSTR